MLHKNQLIESWSGQTFPAGLQFVPNINVMFSCVLYIKDNENDMLLKTFSIYSIPLSNSAFQSEL